MQQKQVFITAKLLYWKISFARLASVNFIFKFLCIVIL